MFGGPGLIGGNGVMTTPGVSRGFNSFGGGDGGSKDAGLKVIHSQASLILLREGMLRCSQMHPTIFVLGMYCWYSGLTISSNVRWGGGKEELGFLFTYLRMRRYVSCLWNCHNCIEATVAVVLVDASRVVLGWEKDITLAIETYDDDFLLIFLFPSFCGRGAFFALPPDLMLFGDKKSGSAHDDNCPCCHGKEVQHGSSLDHSFSAKDGHDVPPGKVS